MKTVTTHYKEILQKFDTHIVSKKSIKSGNHYTSQVDEFLSFLERNDILNLNKISVPIMKEYLNYLLTRPKKRGEGILNVSSVNDNLSTLRAFSIRMQAENILTKSISIPKNLKRERDENDSIALVRQILTTDEVKLVFNTCDSWLEKALIALAYGAGLRRGSLENLLESKIDFKSGMVTAFKDKNNKTRRVPISNFFLEVLKEYSMFRLNILATLNIRETHFFIDHKGKHLSGDNLNEMLKNIVKRTLNTVIMDKNITLHCLRHSTATHLMDAGESFEFIREYLGHSIADTSLIYAKRRKIKNYYQI